MTQQQVQPLGLRLSPMNPEYQVDPFALLDEVREEGRAVKDDLLGRYIVSRFEDVQKVLFTVCPYKRRREVRPTDKVNEHHFLL